MFIMLLIHDKQKLILLVQANIFIYLLYHILKKF